MRKVRAHTSEDCDGFQPSSGTATFRSAESTISSSRDKHSTKSIFSALQKWGLLEEGRSLTFLYVLLNAVCQICIFVVSIPYIIQTYYVDTKVRLSVFEKKKSECIFLHVTPSKA